MEMDPQQISELLAATRSTSETLGATYHNALVQIYQTSETLAYHSTLLHNAATWSKANTIATALIVGVLLMRLTSVAKNQTRF